MRTVKLRDGIESHQPYPIGEFTREIVQSICERIVFLKATGKLDLSGEEFSSMFAAASGGQYLGKPIGIADVVRGRCCWSVKTVKQKQPHSVQSVRIISGRNSPIYSSGISDPLSDVRLTGQSVLDIYNNRVHKAKRDYEDIRLVVFVRNMVAQEFTLFERPIYPLVVNRYRWEVNSRGNLIGFDDDTQVFTWQPHGSQFTIHEPIPHGAIRFRIAHEPEVIQMNKVLLDVGFKPDWVEFL